MPPRKGDREAAALRPFLAGAGLHDSEALVLTALWQADGATETSIASRTAVPVDAVHRLVESLGLLGYVEPEDDGVWLTGDGFRLRQRALRGLAARRN